MATTWYLDPVNGNDSNAGTSFSLRKQNLSSVITAGLAAGDSVRVIGSPLPTDMGQTATFTNQSLLVTLSSSVTQLISACDSAWTGSTNVTTITSAAAKEGTQSASLNIATAFTTGLVAYFATGTLNLSSYNQVSFWINSSTSLSSGVFSLLLCSDTAGTTAVNTITISRSLVANQWTCLTFDTGSALGSSIQSVALYANSDPGTVLILLDDIIACLPSTDVNALTLNSLIGKNGANTPPDHSWWPIKSINGTSVYLDNYTNALVSAGQGYSGATETVEIYIQKCTPTPAVTSLASNTWNFSVSGSAGSPITISGGWDSTAMSTQSLGNTFLDGIDCAGIINANSTTGNYITLDNISFVRYYQLNLSAASLTGFSLDNCYIIGCGFATSSPCVAVTGTSLTAPQYNLFAPTGTIYVISCQGFIEIFRQSVSTIGNLTLLSNMVINTGSLALGIAGSPVFNCNFTGSIISNNGSYYGVAVSCVGTTYIPSISVNYNLEAGMYLLGAEAHILNYSSSNNGNSSTSITCAASSGSNYIYNANFGNDSQHVFSGGGSNRLIYSMAEGGVATSNVIYADGGSTSAGAIFYDTSTVPTGESGAWNMAPNSTTTRTSTYPLRFCLTGQGGIACLSGKTTTVTFNTRRSSTNLVMGLRVFGGVYPGIGSIGSDITVNVTPSANTWTTYSISFTPSVNCVIPIYGECYSTSGTTNHGWFAGPVIVTST